MLVSSLVVIAVEEHFSAALAKLSVARERA